MRRVGRNKDIADVLKVPGRQRTASTRVIVAIHAPNYLENVGETLRLPPDECRLLNRAESAEGAEKETR
jgi:hypothetical protein